MHVLPLTVDNICEFELTNKLQDEYPGGVRHEIRPIRMRHL